MYIIFNEKGMGDLYYYAEPLPEEHEKKQHVKIDEKDIPEKEGYTAIAKLVDGELEWEFVEIPKSEEEILQDKINELDKVNKANMLALMEINSRLNKMESDN